MPAAAVIPAPIAYIKVVAVKKLVVELESVLGGVDLGTFWPYMGGEVEGFTLSPFLLCKRRGYYSKQIKFPSFPGALILV